MRAGLRRLARPTAVALALLLSPARPDGEGPFPPLAPLPPPPVPADNPITPEKVALGKMLFFDTRLASGFHNDCSACHEPTLGWGDGLPISRGSPGAVHYRNSQTALNAAYYERLFWDGSARSLEEQAAKALLGALSQNSDAATIEETLIQIPEYARRFREVFGTESPRFEDMVKAIAAFERAELVSRGAPFDAYARGEQKALSEPARRGLALFEGEAGCIRCHHGPLFSDQGFHATGVPQSAFLAEDPLGQVSVRYLHASRGAPVPAPGAQDPGLYLVTKREADKGKFRTPSLRELLHTAPYMHNGSLDTLEAVVEFYDRGGGAGPNKTGLLKPLGLSPGEKRDLLAFLESLSGEEVIIDPPHTPPFAVDGATVPWAPADPEGPGSP